MTKIFGILNITPDSFSDGGKYQETDVAIQRAVELSQQGAAFIDIGAESTHPDSRKITAEEEIKALTPVVKGIQEKNLSAKISIDTYRPEVMDAMLALGVDVINDVTGLKEIDAIKALATSDAKAVIMYSRSQDAHAMKVKGTYEHIIGELKGFFYDKIAQCESFGLHKERLILDPGMGFFLGANPEPSLKVLKQIAELKELGCPIMISTSRKSFIGTITGKEVQERAAGTLATEVWGVTQGVDYIRTHDVDQLQDAIKMINAIKTIN